MLTTTAQLTKGDLQTAAGRFSKRFSVDGIDVIALDIAYSQEMGVISRCISFIKFIIASSVAVLLARDVDVVYATSSPLTVGIPALVAKWCRLIPFVFEVRDQWPEVPIALGVVKNGLVIKLLLQLEKTIYKNSSAIVALSPGQADGIKEVLSEDKQITVIINGCDKEFFHPNIDGSVIREKYGWDGKLVFLHAGAMGKVNGLDFVVDAAEKLKEHRNIMFVLIGDGNQKPFLESRVKELGLKNVEISPSVPKRELPEILAAADVGLVIIANYPILEHNSANKFFDSLSAGRPVLLNYSGWQRQILEDNKAGFGCELCNLDEFVERVLYFDSHRRQIKQMGRDARRIAEEKFDRTKLAQQVLELLCDVVKATQ